MIEPPTLTGTVDRYLLSGPHEDRRVLIEIEDGDIARVLDAETGEEIAEPGIGREDYDYAIDALLAALR